MSDRRLWCAVVITVVSIASAGSAHGLLVLTVVAGVGAAWLTMLGRLGVAAAGAVVAVAWSAAAGPWSGDRLLATVAGGSLAIVAAALLAQRGRPRIGLAVALLLAAMPAFVGSEPPVTGDAAQTATLRAVDRHLREEVERARIPGAAVAIVEDGRVVFERGYGTARRGEPMTARSPVVLGSTSKSMTATAIMRLAERGEIDLDEPISTYLRWYEPSDPDAARITVRHLLVDTSGIPTWAGWGALAGDGRLDEGSLRSLVRSVQLTREPGDRFQYSNANYIILGLVAEAVTGEPFAAVVDREVFATIGMDDTAATREAAAAQANRWWVGVPIRSELPYLEVGLAAGSMKSSAHDLALYLRAHLGSSGLSAKSFLARAALAELHRPVVEADGFGVPPGRRYAMGWYVGTVAGQDAVFHSGDVFDTSSSLVMLPDRDVGVAVVATTSSALVPVSRTLADATVAVLVDESPPALATPLALSTVAAAAVAAVVLAFAIVRLRRRRSGIVRAATVDLFVPSAVLLGLPWLFSHQLDRAETVDAIELWRLATRAIPDVAWLLLAALAIRILAGVRVVVSAASARRP